MKKILLLLIAAGFSASVSAQKIGIKNNLLYNATLTPNLGLELGLGRKTTLDIYAGYNPFTFRNHTKMKHWLVSPEIRFWNCERFNGFFWGIHGIGGEFNVGDIKFPFGIYKGTRDHRYEGWAAGGGISIGNQWVLGKRWNFELSIGAGYVYVDYDRFECGHCGKKLNSGHKNYFGPTKATVSFIYFFR